MLDGEDAPMKRKFYINGYNKMLAKEEKKLLELAIRVNDLERTIEYICNDLYSEKEEKK